MHKNRYMRQRFNMTELVLVVTLIVCVAAVLLPSVYRGLVRGKAAACQANLKELGNWMTVYVDDHDDYLPAYEDGWVEPLAEIGGGGGGSGVPAGVFACPSQKAVSLDPAGETEAAAWWHGSMNGINQHIASKLVDRNGQPLPWWTRLQTSSIQTSSAAVKVLLVDAAGGNYFGTPDRDPTVAGLSRYGTNYVHSLPPDPVSPFPALRHAGETGPGSGNFLFLDEIGRAHV